MSNELRSMSHESYYSIPKRVCPIRIVSLLIVVNGGMCFDIILVWNTNLGGVLSTVPGYQPSTLHVVSSVGVQI